MEKVLLTRDEISALKSFQGDDLKNDISYYIECSEGFDSNYKLLKNMGFEKFVKALIIGYKEKLPKFNIGEFHLAFNYEEMEYIKSGEDAIYYEIKNNEFDNPYGSISIEKTKEIIKALEELVNYYEMYKEN